MRVLSWRKLKTSTICCCYAFCCCCAASTATLLSSIAFNVLCGFSLLTCFITSSDCGCSIGKKNISEWISSRLFAERRNEETRESWSCDGTLMKVFFSRYAGEKEEKGQTNISENDEENFLITTSVIGFSGTTSMFSHWTLTLWFIGAGEAAVQVELSTPQFSLPR